MALGLAGQISGCIPSKWNDLAQSSVVFGVSRPLASRLETGLQVCGPM